MKILTPGFTTAISLVAFLVCVLVSGCREARTATTWSTELRSPDGSWVAIARSEKMDSASSAGPGFTTVYLKSGNQTPVETLRFSHDSATIDLKMHWTAPNHLDVAFGSHAKLEFQNRKIDNIEVSSHEISTDASDPPR